MNRSLIISLNRIFKLDGVKGRISVFEEILKIGPDCLINITPIIEGPKPLELT